MDRHAVQERLFKRSSVPQTRYADTEKENERRDQQRRRSISFAVTRRGLATEHFLTGDDNISGGPHPGRVSPLSPRGSDAGRSSASSETSAGRTHQTVEQAGNAYVPPSALDERGAMNDDVLWTCHKCHVEVEYVPECWCCEHNRCNECLPGSRPRQSRMQRLSLQVSDGGARRGSSAASSAKSSAGSSNSSRRSHKEEKEKESLQGMIAQLKRARVRELEGGGRRGSDGSN